jgi:hypothetical protein
LLGLSGPAGAANTEPGRYAVTLLLASLSLELFLDLIEADAVKVTGDDGVRSVDQPEPAVVERFRITTPGLD